MYPVIPLLVLTVFCTSVAVISHIGNTKYNTNLPFFASVVDYSFMTSICVFKRSRKDARTNIWGIFLTGLCDCTGNSLMCLSLKYTSITSVALINNL